MTLKSDLVQIERSLWKGGVDAYRRNLDDDCLVAFGQQAGVSTREEVAGTVKEGARWEDVKLEVEGLLQPTPDVAILTYRASAMREDEPYHALVSSGYVRREEAWKLMFHQQTPLEG